MNQTRLVLGMLLAAFVGYFLVVPIYGILSDNVHLNDFMMLGIGIIMAVVLVKFFARIGSFVTLGMLLLLGVILIIVGIAMDVDADGDVGDETESVMSDGTSDYIGGFAYSGCGGRQMNGTLWKFRTYRDPGDTTNRIIWGYFTNNDGDDWDVIKIMDNTHEYFETGEYPYYVFDVVMLSNNSIILALGLYANEMIESHLICHWNNSDLSQWERVLVYSEYDTTDFGMNVNATDGIVFAVEYWTDPSLWSYKFNPSTRETTELGIKNNVRNLLDKIYVFWNGTAWTLCYQHEPGTGDRLYIYNEDFSTLIHEGPSINSIRTINDLVLTGDGTYVYTYNDDTGGWPILRYWNETGSGLRMYISSISSWSVNSMEIALRNDNDTQIKIYGYYYGYDEFHEWAWLNYYDDREIFKNNQQKWFEETTDWGNNKNFVDWAPYKLYPQIWDPINETYIHTQLPNNGTWNLFQECDPDNDPDFWSTGPYPDMETRGYSIWPDIPWGGNGGNGGGGPYNPGGGGGPGNLQVSFIYQDTTWGIKFTPVHPMTYQVDGYRWLFGDGSSSTRKSPTHWYRNPGEYIVTIEIRFSNGVVSKNSQNITVNEFSDLQYLFHMIERDDDRIYLRFNYYEVVFTELSLLISGMLAFVAVYVSLHDRKKYKRFKESTATVVLRIIGIIWVGIAVILLIWIRMGGI